MNNYCHSKTKAAAKWRGEGFTSVQFDSEIVAREFIRAWSSPGVSVILNCVTHDQHPKYCLIPAILCGDIIHELGLDQYRNRMIEEERHYTARQGEVEDDVE